MDVLLLGAAAIVLIALTLWLVWRPAETDGAVRAEEAADMMPQGDRFEDQYTSATADLSAAGVAITAAQEEAGAAPEASAFQRASEPWSQPSLAREGALPPAQQQALPEPSLASRVKQPRTIGIGVAAILTLAGAAIGAWLYSRWQHERNKPLNRVRRRFR
ncbi:MAG: hypothetical protein JO020_19805 [Chloroflexi bacterium]|nr:hypothetical protein [Chloroflexota bacterium]